MSTAAKNSQNKDAVQDLTDANFDDKVLKSDLPWLVAFVSDQCGHCQRLKPDWKEAAEKLKGIVNVGKIEAQMNQAKFSQYEIRGFPTIKFFPAGSSSSSDAIDYDASRDADSIVTWANNQLESSLPDPEVVELTDSQIFESECKGHALCVIAAFPSLYDCDAKCRNAYIQLLKDEAKEFKKQKWGWVWLEALKQEEFEKGLDIGGSGYPTMVALHLGKMKRVALFGPFSKTGIHNFLFSISVGGGKLPMTDIRKIPQLETTDPWDGQDAPPIIEEDLDDLDTKMEL